MNKQLYLIDGHYQIYRAFFGLPQQLTSPGGEPTGATHVFCAMLFNLIRSRRPDYLAMVMDVSDETVFRRELDENYKAHRDPPPEALEIQAERIASIVTALGIPIFRLPGFEADDIMATIAHRLRDDTIDIFLVSRDKDLDQLISDRVRIYDPTKDQVVDAETLLATKGYAPAQAVEIQALTGDSTDNIPGVSGVGPKTAVKLIAKYGTAEEVIRHADEQTARMREQLKAFAELLPRTRQLVTLRRDVPIDFDLSLCAIDRLNPDAALPVFKELGFSRLTDSLMSLATGPADTTRNSAAPELGPATPSLPGMGEASYHLIDTPDALADFVSALGRQAAFALDTETTGINPVSSQLVGLSFSWKAGEAYYLPVRAALGKALPLELVVEKLKPILENPSVAKVGHHVKYDMVVLRQVGLKVAGAAFDTMIASFVLEPQRRSHSLDSLVKGLIGHEMIPITDLIGKGKNQITMDLVDTARVCEYAAEDADFTWRLRETLEPQMSGSEVEPLFRETEMPLVNVLAEMEHNGITLDVELLGELGASMTKRLSELTEQVHRAAGRAFNIDSPKQLAEVLFDELGFAVVRKTKTGRSTDAETLEELSTLTDHPVPRLVLEYRELAKLKGTYVETLPTMVCRRTGRLHASFHQTGAVTGRLSSSDPNLQNIPVRSEAGRRIREAIVAGDPDHVLLAADYSQIELRLLAHFCEDEALRMAFREGRDIHRSVAAEVNGISIEEVTAAQRSAAKAINFGIIYGQSAFGLARTLGVPAARAKDFIDTYFRRYPGIKLFISRCVEEARSRGFAQTLLGRRRPIPELVSRNRSQVAFGERIAVNTVVQGSAADLIKRAMIAIHREWKASGAAAMMVIQVHDELVFEVARRQLEAVAAMIKRHMEQAVQLSVPVEVDIGWGRTWADAKKEAS